MCWRATTQMVTSKWKSSTATARTPSRQRLGASTRAGTRPSPAPSATVDSCRSAPMMSTATTKGSPCRCKARRIARPVAAPFRIDHPGVVGADRAASPLPARRQSLGRGDARSASEETAVPANSAGGSTPAAQQDRGGVQRTRGRSGFSSVSGPAADAVAGPAAGRRGRSTPIGAAQRQIADRLRQTQPQQADRLAIGGERRPQVVDRPPHLPAGDDHRFARRGQPRRLAVAVEKRWPPAAAPGSGRAGSPPAASRLSRRAGGADRTGVDDRQKASRSRRFITFSHVDYDNN